MSGVATIQSMQRTVGRVDTLVRRMERIASGESRRCPQVSICVHCSAPVELLSDPQCAEAVDTQQRAGESAAACARRLGITPVSGICDPCYTLETVGCGTDG